MYPHSMTARRIQIRLPGPSAGNPIVDVRLSAHFQFRHRTVDADGFYDGSGTYRIRVMPDERGQWTYTISNNIPALDGKAGTFSVTRASRLSCRPGHGLARRREHPRSIACRQTTGVRLGRPTTRCSRCLRETAERRRPTSAYKPAGKRGSLSLLVTRWQPDRLLAACGRCRRNPRGSRDRRRRTKTCPLCRGSSRTHGLVAGWEGSGRFGSTGFGPGAGWPLRGAPIRSPFSSSESARTALAGHMDSRRDSAQVPGPRPGDGN